MLIALSFGVNAIVLILLVTVYGKLEELNQTISARLPEPEKPVAGPETPAA
jgi:hypothetical protein